MDDYMLSTLLWTFDKSLFNLSPSWLVSKATSLSQHLTKQGFNTWYKLTTMWKTSHMNGTPMTTQPHQKQYVLISKRFFLLHSGTLSTFWEETRLPPPQGFSWIQMWIVLEQPLTRTQRKIIFAYRTLNHRLALQFDYGWVSLSLKWEWEWGTIRVGNVPYTNPIRNTIWECSSMEPQIFLSITPTS